MFGFLCFIALLSFITCGVLIIVSLFKHNGNTKKFTKGIIVSFILCIVLGFFAPDTPEDKQVATKSTNNIATEQQAKDNNTSDKKQSNKQVTKVANKKSTENANDIKADTSTSVNGNLKIHYIDVGQADSILIQQNGHNMLIDAGNNADSNLVIHYLKGQGVSKLDYVIGTHPHEDHIGGLDVVINTFDIGKVFMPKKISTTKTYRDLITAIKSKGLKITTPVPNSTYSLGGAKWTILAPSKNKDYEDVNNYSIVCRLKYGNTSFMFDGDAEAVSEMEMVNRGNLESVDVLKVGHHGSNSSSCINFLKKVNPKYAVISCGNNNKYGHPHKGTMDRLKSNNVKVYRTDECGTIICTSDGKNIKFNKKQGSYNYKGNGATASKSNSSTKKKSNTTNKRTVKPTPKPTPNPSQNKGVTVYVTNTGKKYHSAGCRYLRKSKIPIKLKDAKAQGYTPCSRCCPPQ